jgi:hypothetical protein
MKVASYDTKPYDKECFSKNPDFRRFYCKFFEMRLGPIVSIAHRAAEPSAYLLTTRSTANV